MSKLALKHAHNSTFGLFPAASLFRLVLYPLVFIDLRFQVQCQLYTLKCRYFRIFLCSPSMSCLLKRDFSYFHARIIFQEAMDFLKIVDVREFRFEVLGTAGDVSTVDSKGRDVSLRINLDGERRKHLSSPPSFHARLE